jgi:thymidylate synthase (FAD)
MPAEPRQAVFRSDVTAELIKHAAADVIWAARVSTAGEQSLDEIEADPGRSAGLIKLSDAGSPRHSVRAFFDDLLCAGPDLVLREFMRHRTFSFNEESGRYRELAGRPLRHELVVSATQRACTPPCTRPATHGL